MKKEIAIIDYGMGNLFSVLNACTAVGLTAEITSDVTTIRESKAIILPGVGAFPDAMASLKERKLDALIKEEVARGKPLFGICLGMQLLMTESVEFGKTQGLNLIPGSVVGFDHPQEGDRKLKVPEVQWNQIFKPASQDIWNNTLLNGIKEGTFFYFVHSYYCVPASDKHVLTRSKYGQIDYCSSVYQNNIFACQFHPERSGEEGLNIYRNFAKVARSQ